jgi:hypothetical protein
MDFSTAVCFWLGGASDASVRSRSDWEVVGDELELLELELESLSELCRDEWLDRPPPR